VGSNSPLQAVPRTLLLDATVPAGSVEAGALPVQPTSRFEPQGVLGEGGMGTVERVRDRDLLREVAVKHLRPELESDGGLLSQFLWEARVTAHLDHPNIVPVHDLGRTPEGHLFIVMKLVVGDTLEDVINRAREAGSGEEALQRRLRQFLQLCHAVSFAHNRGVLHRDLKPSNVMVGAHGEVLVTDWGIAVPLPGDAGAALQALAPGNLMAASAGTPMYMSAEQARGDTLDERSDVYALGAILYEVVSLERAIQGNSLPEVLGHVMRGEVEPLAKVAPWAPPVLGLVVAKAMALDPKDRYATVTALAEDVEAVLDGKTPSCEDVSALKRFARFYVGRDRAFGEMRVGEVDLWVASGGIIGAGVGILFARFTALWWPFVVIGSILAAIPTIHFIQLRRRR
jgi:serine/threonine protein kinase